MSVPKFVNKGNLYLFQWDDGLECEVSRIRQHRDGRTTCRIIFRLVTKEKTLSLLQKDGFNLAAGNNAMNRKELTSRYSSKTIDWTDVLETVCVNSINEYESGEPVIELSSVEDVEPLDYIIDPFLPRNKPTFFFGEPGSGKSQVALVSALICALPWGDNNLRLTAPEEPVKTLYLDYEADKQDILRQWKFLINGMNLGAVSLYYRRCALSLADDMEAVKNYIENTGAGLVIIDSVSLAAGGDLNKMDMATGYLRALRQIHATTLSLAHTSKDKESKDKTILGSILFEAGARSVWEVRGQEEDDALSIAMFHRKSNISKKFSPLGYRVNYNCVKNTIEWYDPKSVPEFVERMGTNQRILQILSKEHLSTKGLIERLELPRHVIDNAVSRLRKKSLIAGTSDEWYRL